MEFEENYDPYQHFAKLQIFIQSSLGEPVEPTTEEVLNKWEQMANNLPPRTFMFMVDIRKSDVVRAAGMSLLGYADNFRFNTANFIEWTHENQKNLVAYLTLSMYEVFFDYPNLIRNKSFEYCTTRGIKDRHGKYWNTHQAAYPAQFDENGLMVRYISTYRVLGPYTGQPLETYVYYNDDKYKAELKILSDKVNEIKEGMLQALSLTKQEKWILDLRANAEMSSRQVAEHLEITMKTLHNHHGSINRKARAAFPLNDFANINDVISYLKQQRLI